MDVFRDAAVFLGELESRSVAYMVVGGVALDAYAVGRTTLDLDIQVLLDRPPAKTDALVFGAIVEERTRDEVFGQDALVLHPATSPLWIEVFLTSHWFTRQALERRVRIESRLLGRAVPVPRREDLILLKAAYSRSVKRSEAKRVQDVLDVESIIQGAPSLDRAYLRDNGEKLQVRDIVDRCLPG